jgi:hypothetical protein
MRAALWRVGAGDAEVLRMQHMLHGKPTKHTNATRMQRHTDVGQSALLLLEGYITRLGDGVWREGDV